MSNVENFPQGWGKLAGQSPLGHWVHICMKPLDIYCHYTSDSVDWGDLFMILKWKFNITNLYKMKSLTAGRRGWQSVCAWQTWHGYYLHVMSWSSLNINVFCSLQKDSLKESEGWCKVISSKTIVTLFTQGLPSSLLYHPVAY